MRNPILAAAFSVVLTGCVVTPEPLTESELALTAETNIAQVTENQEPVTRSISLYEAMARALKYNLDHRVELYANALAAKKLASAKASMLPSLVANSAYNSRNNGSYSRSETLSGVRSVEPSKSREDATLTKDLTFSWNILDFGLSYVRAKQAADQTLVASEQKRKVINRIIEDVRTAYWRSVSAERLLKGFSRLEARVERALKNSQALGGSGYTSPVAALTYQRELVDIKGQAQKLQRELRTSKIQLAALMNLKPDEHYHLVIPKRRISNLQVQIPSDEMVRLALQNRPELREISYSARINELEAEAALLELLPGIQLFASGNYDSNDFLHNSNWINVGAKASWNMMKLFSHPARKGEIQEEQNLIHQRSLAMTMAIMTQVEVAKARYAYLRRSASTAAKYHGIQAKILKHVKTEARIGSASEQNLIREEMNTLLASAKYDIAYSDLQNAFATIYASIGVDPWGDYLDTDTDVATLAQSLKKTWRERGDTGG